MKLLLKWLDLFVNLLATKIVAEQNRINEERKWRNAHRDDLRKARAIAMIEAPEKAHDYNYLKSKITN